MKNIGATFLLLVLARAGLLCGQTSTGAIAGIVTDPSGAAVSGAAVRISNPDTGLFRDLTSSGQGAYSAPALPSGL